MLQKAESVWHLDHAHSGRTLLVDNLVAQGLHSRPMHLRPEMMLSMIAVIEPSPVIQLAVGAHAPRNRLVGIAAVMPIVTVQIREAVTKVPKRQKETDVTPVENAEDHKGRHEGCKLEDTPKGFARVLALQFFKHCFGIFAKETEESVLQRMFGFAVVSVLVDRNPINSLTSCVWPVRVAFVMLHVNAFVE